MQLGDFILAYQSALLGLTQLHLNLLYLAFMASLFLLALIFDGVAIVLQRFTGVQVFFFQRADLLVLVLQAQFEIRQCLVQSGVAGLLGLQHRAGVVQFRRFLGQRQALNFVLLLQFGIGLAGLVQLGFQFFSLLLELRACLVD